MTRFLNTIFIGELKTKFDKVVSFNSDQHMDALE